MLLTKSPVRQSLSIGNAVHPSLEKRAHYLAEGFVHMAKCPNCGFSLKPWHIFAECPKCKVNIPNYNWEERLEQDSIAAEAALNKIRDKFEKFKYSMIGNKLRIARIPVSVLPLFSFLLPLFTATLNLPFAGGKKSYNLISIISAFTKFDLKGLKAYLGSPIVGDAALKLLLSTLLIYISALTLLFSLYFLLFNYRNFHSYGLFATNLIGALAMAGSGVFFSSFLAMQQASTINAFSGKIGFGLYISAGLFLISSVTNFAVARSKAEMPEPKEMKKTAEKVKQSTAV